MGKRRRKSAAKGETGKPHNSPRSNKRNSQKGEADPSAEPAPDIDDDCVRYESESEEEKTQAQKAAKTEHIGDGGVEEQDSEDEDEEESGAELALGEAAADESDVEVGLEFFDPTEADITPVAVFLEKFTFASVGVTKSAATKNTGVVQARDLATAICKQTRVGTMVRVSDDDAPIGFISCLNVHEHRGLLDPIKRHLLAVCGGKSEHERFAQIVGRTFEMEKKFESCRMGLILCERVVNLPPQIVPKMLEALFCEIAWAVEDEPTEAGREAFRIGWYLYITEVFCTGASAVGDVQGEGADRGGEAGKGGERAAKKRKVRKGGEQEMGTANVTFTRVEDEAWLAHAACSVTWDVAGEETEKGGFRRRRMAMIIPSGKVGKVREMVVQLAGVDAGEEEVEGDGVLGGEPDE